MEHLDTFDRLPNLDSPTLDEEMATILVRDRVLLLDLYPLIESFTWSEKMAIGLAAYSSIDTSDGRPFKLTVAQGEISGSLQQAYELVKQLSPQALAELAAWILEEDFEISEASRPILSNVATHE